MPTELLEKNQDTTIGQIVLRDVLCLQVLMANVCFIGKPKSDNWILIDAGLASTADRILDAAAQHYGKGNAPKAIILTHGHFDHVGALDTLIKEWNVPVFAHKDELPFLTGQKDYPEPDPTVGGGMMSLLSPMYPNEAINLGDKVKSLPEDGTIPFMKEWRYVHTPGHTPGHISLFRDEDRVLISGDAFITVDQESALAVLTQEKEVNGPPAYFTTDWTAAKNSVRKLAELKPSLVITGHGLPISGEKLTSELERLANNFDELAVPDQGKYVNN
jgi:glyoxylase-like metal-dependent hydrolase (beta-lactamase superfamily II)